MYVQSNTEARSLNHCCRGKALSIIPSEFVFVAFVTQHAKSMRRIIFSSVACPAIPYFSALSHKRYNFRKKKKIEYQTCVLLFSTTFPEKFLILRRFQTDFIINIHSTARNVMLFLGGQILTLILLMWRIG